MAWVTLAAQSALGTATSTWANQVKGDLDYLLASGGQTSINLPPETWTAPLSKLTAAGVELDQSSDAGTPCPQWYSMTFGTAKVGRISRTFELPANYSSGPIIEYAGYTNATTGTLTFGIQVAAVSATDTSRTAKAFSTVNIGTVDVPSAAAKDFRGTIALANADSMAARDMVTLALIRDPADAGDTFAGTAYLTHITFRYTGG